jgi:hypothetical protein
MSSLLLTDNLSTLCVEMKEIICHGLGWNYNDVDIEITWRCQIDGQQYYHVPIMCDCSFKIMIDSFIQNGLNIMILYVNSRPQSMCVPTSIGP